MVIITINNTNLLFYYSIFEVILDVVHYSIAQLYLIKDRDVFQVIYKIKNNLFCLKKFL
jgi:hypothetical protein